MSQTNRRRQRPPIRPTGELAAIAAYVRTARPLTAATAYETARYCLMDTLACGLQALQFPACRRLLGSGRAGHGHARRGPRAGHRL